MSSMISTSENQAPVATAPRFMSAARMMALLPVNMSKYLDATGRYLLHETPASPSNSTADAAHVNRLPRGCRSKRNESTEERRREKDRQGKQSAWSDGWRD